ncbi:MAG: hypothetical protein KDC38_19780, partial [Planctomycetes bacterium]|nr:hypothetical protein [Planctomycetota bacterium]
MGKLAILTVLLAVSTMIVWNWPSKERVVGVDSSLQRSDSGVSADGELAGLRSENLSLSNALKEAQGKVAELKSQLADKSRQLAEVSERTRSTPRRILESLFVEPGEEVYTKELIDRARNHESPQIRALVKELQLSYYSHEDALKLAWAQVESHAQTPAGLVAAK